MVLMIAHGWGSRPVRTRVGVGNKASRRFMMKNYRSAHIVRSRNESNATTIATEADDGDQGSRHNAARGKAGEHATVVAPQVTGRIAAPGLMTGY